MGLHGTGVMGWVLHGNGRKRDQLAGWRFGFGFTIGVGFVHDGMKSNTCITTWVYSWT